MASTIHGSAAAKRQQKPTATVVEKQQQEEANNNNKLNHHNFLYKAAIVAILFVILPLFPSQAPEFINQSALVTRNWELLHILFVGVAISYGLFSRKTNTDEGKDDNNNNNNNAQTLVSRFLQVSSFFEDDAETTPSELLSSSESDHDHDSQTTKVQTWSNQHHWKEPVVVVARSQQANHHSNFESKIGEKPLLLPVRSLKSRLCDESRDHDRDRDGGDDDDDDDDDDVDGGGGVQHVNETSCLSLNRSIASKAGSKSFSSSNNSSKARNIIGPEIEGSGGSFKVKDNVVLPSPIPWRSRSGRLLESNKQVLETQTYASKPSSIEEPELSNKVESRPPKLSQNSRSSRNSPNSFSTESLAKNAEDLLKKKGFCKSCPPPPPPPPPMFFYKSISMRPSYGNVSSFNGEGGGSFDKELKRSFTNVGGGGMKKNGSQEPTRKTNMEEERESSFLDKVVMESYDDDEDDSSSETEDEDVVGRSTVMQKSSVETQPIGEASRTDGADEGPDVDKKADEFIAKFREQIRLQRIESIKRSTRSARNSSYR